MALKIIGSGFGRTGTDSMRIALETLGFGPCHHMRSLFNDERHRQDWLECVQSGVMDWNRLLDGYASCVDWPSAYYWPELIERYPEAKVLLTWRDPKSWWSSMVQTIVPSVEKDVKSGTLGVGATILLKHVLNGAPMTQENFLAAYEANVARVTNSIPQDRLLVYKLGSGWEPLCEFLGAPLPDIAFPRSNSAEEFHKWKKPE